MTMANISHYLTFWYQETPLYSDRENAEFSEMNVDNEHKLSYEGGDKWVRNPETYYSHHPTTRLWM